MKLYFFYFAVLLNCIGLDITFERYIQSYIIKFIILGLFFIPVLINRNLKIANKSYRSIFKLIILYIALNILIGLLYENDRFTNIFINSTFSFTLPLFIFYYYINLNITKFITLFKIMPIILLLIGVLFDLFNLNTLFRIEDNGVNRLQGTSIPANYAMIIFFSCIAHLKDSTKKPNLKKYIYLLINLSLLFLTGSRMALFCTILFIFLIEYKKIKLPILIKILFFTTFFTTSIFYLIYNNSRNVNSENEFNSSGREVSWTFFMEKFSQNSTYGIGHGNSLKYFKNGEIQYFTTPHNEYIRLLLEGGIIITSIISTIIIYRLYCALKRYKTNKNQNNLLLILLYTTTLIYSFTDNNFATYQYYLNFLLFVLILGKNDNNDNIININKSFQSIKDV